MKLLKVGEGEWNDGSTQAKYRIRGSVARMSEGSERVKRRLSSDARGTSCDGAYYHQTTDRVLVSTEVTKVWECSNVRNRPQDSWETRRPSVVWLVAYRSGFLL